MKTLLISHQFSEGFLSLLDKGIPDEHKSNLLLVTDNTDSPLSQHTIPYEIMQSHTIRPNKKLLREHKPDVILLDGWKHPTIGIPPEKLMSLATKALVIRRYGRVRNGTNRICTIKDIMKEQEKRNGVSFEVSLAYKNQRGNDQTTFFECAVKITETSQDALEALLKTFRMKWILYILPTIIQIDPKNFNFTSLYKRPFAVYDITRVYEINFTKEFII